MLIKKMDNCLSNLETQYGDWPSYICERMKIEGIIHLKFTAFETDLV